MACPDRHHVEMLSLPACRRLLGKAGDGMSDDHLARLRDQLYTLAHCAIAAFVQDASDEPGATVLACLPPDVSEEVEERAAILQFDANLPRGLATRAAVSAYVTAIAKAR